MGILVLNGNRITLNGNTISLGGPDPAPAAGPPAQIIMASAPGKMM